MTLSDYIMDLLVQLFPAVVAHVVAILEHVDGVRPGHGEHRLALGHWRGGHQAAPQRSLRGAGSGPPLGS